MPLEFVKPPTDVNMNVLLYGPPKTGKSIGAASAPGPVLYLNADTPDSTRVVHARYGDKINEVKFEDLSTLVDVTTLVRSGEYRSLILDPIGEAHRRILEGLSGRAMRPSRDAYGDTTTHLERFCRTMCDEPINFVVVAHETVERDEESGTFERLPFTGTSNPKLGAKLMGMVGVLGYTAVITQAEEGQEPTYHYVAQLVNGKGRRGGSRYPLGPVRAVDLTEWENTIKSNEAPASEPVQKEAVAA